MSRYKLERTEPYTGKSRRNKLWETPSLLCGVGIRDADYIVRPEVDGEVIWCPYYRVWANLINRCYGKQKPHCYIGVTVCKEWHSFMKFRIWMMKQDWKDKSLDKDLLVRGNKVYSPDNCMFISRTLNFMLTSRNIKCEFPCGVSRTGETSYRTQATVNGERRSKSGISSPEEAHRLWQKWKIEHLLALSYKECGRVKDALVSRSLIIQYELDNNLESLSL